MRGMYKKREFCVNIDNVVTLNFHSQIIVKQGDVGRRSEPFSRFLKWFADFNFFGDAYRISFVWNTADLFSVNNVTVGPY